jgi:hypothetical protein
MKFEKIIRLGGKVIFDELSNLIDYDIALISENLKEDLLQAAFPNEQILDIGWYPEFDKNGAFRISLIADRDWESPIYTDTAKTWSDLDKILDHTLHKVKKI